MTQNSPELVAAVAEAIYNQSSDSMKYSYEQVKSMALRDGYIVAKGTIEITTDQARAAITAARPFIEAEMRERVNRLEDALLFYASDDNYKCTEPYWNHATAPPTLSYALGYPDAKVLYDAGRTAKAAITTTTPEGE